MLLDRKARDDAPDRPRVPIHCVTAEARSALLDTLAPIGAAYARKVAFKAEEGVSLLVPSDDGSRACVLLGIAQEARDQDHLSSASWSAFCLPESTASPAMITGANLPIRLRVLLPIAENGVAADSFRPGDVLSSRKGLAVEVGNTDAEGRFILADARALADEDSPAPVRLRQIDGGCPRFPWADLPAFYTMPTTSPPTSPGTVTR